MRPRTAFATLTDARARGAGVQKEDGDITLFSVFVPTNHIYIGDIFLLGACSRHHLELALAPAMMPA